ncbi:N-acylsphingosine amidohydrolase 1 [Homo sapiens]|uniref:N-acylsphingosine amidohydrolase 1 n=2 Tax=Homo sapiens TaxID=9606 RepID=A0A1B0GVL2_HUMAN|nr:N-acylsphingosine amidohydrolase 1 [Homo sapiens]KAI4009688.1 N-acylsphingosine amidohydrolase 1 [Homo sapiens]
MNCCIGLGEKARGSHRASYPSLSALFTEASILGFGSFAVKAQVGNQQLGGPEWIRFSLTPRPLNCSLSLTPRGQRTAENQPILLQDQRTEVQFHGTP